MEWWVEGAEAIAEHGRDTSKAIAEHGRDISKVNKEIDETEQAIADNAAAIATLDESVAHTVLFDNEKVKNSRITCDSNGDVFYLTIWRMNNSKLEVVFDFANKIIRYYLNETLIKT